MLNAENIREKLAKLKENNTDSKTLLRKIKSLKKFLHWARQKGVLKRETFSELEDALRIEESKLVPNSALGLSISRKQQQSENNDLRPSLNEVNSSQRALLIPMPSARHALATVGLMIAVIAIAGFLVGSKPATLPQGQVLAARAAGSKPLTFTGMLKDKEGNAITFPTYVNLKLYNSPAGRQELYASGKCFVRPGQEGGFRITVGVDCGPPVTNQIFAQNPQLFLGISVADDAELTPREKVATAGLAEEAQSIDGLKLGKDISSIPFIDKSGAIELTATASAIRATATDGNFTVGSSHTLTMESATDNVYIKTGGQQRAVFDKEGRVGIGTFTPEGLLAVANNQFVVSPTGNLDKVNGVAYSWPVLQGPPGSVLTNNGSGILSWVPAGGADTTSGTLDFNQFKDTMTVDAATTINLAKAGLTISANDSGHFTVSLPSTGDFLVKSGTSTFATFSHDGTFTLDAMKLVDNSLTSTSGDLNLSAASGAVNVKSSLKVNLTGATTTNGLCHTNATGTSQEELVDCSATPGDVAEWYAAHSEVGPGDIVGTSADTFSYESEGADPATGTVKSLGTQTITVMDKAQKDTDVIGIVSTGPYQVLGEDVKKGVESSGRNDIRAIPLALAGRVPVKVSGEGGAVKAGDYLTLSSTHGVAMRANAAGVTIGKALEDWQPFSGRATVLVLVHLSWYDPSGKHVAKNESWSPGFVSWAKNSVESVSSDFSDAAAIVSNYQSSVVDQFITAKIILTERLIAQKAIFQEVTAEKLVAAQATIADNLHVGGKVISPIVETDQLTAKNVTANTIEAKNVQTNEIKAASDEIAVKLDQDKGKLASLIIRGLKDAPVASVDAQGNATFAGTLSSREATVAGTLTASRVDAANIRDLESRTSRLSDNSSKLDTNLNDVRNLISQLRSDPLSDPAYYSGKLPQLSSEITGGQSNLSFSGKTNFYDIFITHSAAVGTTYIDSEGVSSLGQELRLTALSSVNILDGAVIISRDGTLTTEGTIVAKGGVKTKDLSIQNSDGKAVAAVDAKGQATFQTLNLSDQAAGTGTLPQNERQVTISNKIITANSLVYVTPTKAVPAGQLAVVKKETCEANESGCTPSFTISLGVLAPTDIPFQWLIIN